MKEPYGYIVVNSLPNDIIVDWSNLKAFHVTEKMKFVLGRVENIMEKEEILVTSILSFSHNVFKRLLL